MMVSNISKRFSPEIGHPTKKNIIIFPNHGSQEVGTGLEKKILKEAGIR